VSTVRGFVLSDAMSRFLVTSDGPSARPTLADRLADDLAEDPKDGVQLCSPGDCVVDFMTLPHGAYAPIAHNW